MNDLEYTQITINYNMKAGKRCWAGSCEPHIWGRGDRKGEMDSLNSPVVTSILLGSPKITGISFAIFAALRRTDGWTDGIALANGGTKVHRLPKSNDYNCVKYLEAGDCFIAIAL